MIKRKVAFCGLLLSVALIMSSVPGQVLGIESSVDERGIFSNQPDGQDTIELTFENLDTVSFVDVNPSADEADAIQYVAYRQIMQGIGDGNFSPDGYLTNSDAAVIFQRLAEETQKEFQKEDAASQDDTALQNNKPMIFDAEDDAVLQNNKDSDGSLTDKKVSVFSDISPDDWYAEAVNWGVQAGVITGNSDGIFAPDQRVTRAQLAVMLYRYADYVEKVSIPTTGLSAYRDTKSVPAYASDSLAWVLEQGLFDPIISDTIHPQLPVSRAQFAQILVALIAYTTQEPLAVQLAGQDSLETVTSASRAAHSKIENVIKNTAAKYGAEGVQVVVIEGGKVTDTFATGWATKNVDPMTVDHRMRIASISKVVIGMETARLREMGCVNLDTPVGTYWGVSSTNPYYPDVPVTIRSILSHTSSISNLGDDASRSYSAVRSRLTSSSGYSRLVPGSMRSWSYNNYAFSVLGMAVELAANQTMDQLLNRDFFDIMQIDGAFSAGDLKDNSKLVTLVYQNGTVARSVAMQRDMHSSTTPGALGNYFAGGLMVSSTDLGKIVAMLANDGNYEGLQLLQPESVTLMETINQSQLGDGSYQALPLRYQKNLYGRNGLYYHTGSAYGVYNWMSYDPETKDGVVVLTVGASGAKDNRGIYAICGEISSYIYNVTKN